MTKTIYKNFLSDDEISGKWFGNFRNRVFDRKLFDEWVGRKVFWVPVQN